MNIALELPVDSQQVTVTEQGLSVDTSADNNASAIVIKGKDLDALSDDPDELQSELNALAGPSAGPNGGQIYIDGFSGGQLPPKSSIREIRINQNPFSAALRQARLRPHRDSDQAGHRQVPRLDYGDGQRLGIQFDESLCDQRARLLHHVHCPPMRRRAGQVSVMVYQLL